MKNQMSSAERERVSNGVWHVDLVGHIWIAELILYLDIMKVFVLHVELKIAFQNCRGQQQGGGPSCFGACIHST